MALTGSRAAEALVGYRGNAPAPARRPKLALRLSRNLRFRRNSLPSCKEAEQSRITPYAARKQPKPPAPFAESPIPPKQLAQPQRIRRKLHNSASCAEAAKARRVFAESPIPPKQLAQPQGIRRKLQNSASCAEAAKARCVFRGIPDSAETACPAARNQPKCIPLCAARK